MENGDIYEISHAKVSDNAKQELELLKENRVKENKAGRVAEGNKILPQIMKKIAAMGNEIAKTVKKTKLISAEEQIFKQTGQLIAGETDNTALQADLRIQAKPQQEDKESDIASREQITRIDETAEQTGKKDVQHKRVATSRMLKERIDVVKVDIYEVQIEGRPFIEIRGSKDGTLLGRKEGAYKKGILFGADLPDGTVKRDLYGITVQRDPQGNVFVNSIRDDSVKIEASLGKDGNTQLQYTLFGMYGVIPLKTLAGKAVEMSINEDVDKQTVTIFMSDGRVFELTYDKVPEDKLSKLNSLIEKRKTVTKEQEASVISEIYKEKDGISKQIQNSVKSNLIGSQHDTGGTVAKFLNENGE
ncbi:MAG: hypothetical protein KAQ85_00975, partial [Thermodesulfovibrionia bacterium]|nr:hypothetical protein [Thermodesulfovibrionia bacterium]